MNQENLVCYQRDVKHALQNVIKRFCEGEDRKIGVLMSLIEEELSNVPLYEPIDMVNKDKEI